MINEAQVFLAGYVATEPTCRTTTRGKSEAKMRVGYTLRRMERDTGEWADGPTSFVTVLSWGRLADNVAICMRKGEPVVVMGTVRVREYEKDGVQRISVDVHANSIGYDMSRGVARFSRTRPSSGETAADGLLNGLSAADSGDLDTEGADGLAQGAEGTPQEADGGFFDDSALATLAQQDSPEPSGTSAPF